MDLEALLALIDTISTMTDEELAAWRSSLHEAANGLLDNDTESELTGAEIAALLTRVADAIEAVDGQVAARAEADAETEAAIAEQLARINGAEASDGDDEEEAEGDDAESDEDEGEEAEANADEPELEAVSASGEGTPPAPVPTRSPLAQLAGRRPRQRVPAQAKGEERRAFRATAAGDVAGVTAGGEFPTLESVDAALIQRHAAFAGSRQGISEQVTVARFHGDYASDRKVDGSMSAAEITSRFAAVDASITQEAIVASGGLCAPTEAYYELDNVTQAARPVRDSLVRFDAGRGGIRYQPSPKLSDIGTTGGSPNQAIGVVTEDQDTSGATKVYQTVTCGQEQEVVVQAITNILKFGNWSARTFPEKTTVITALAAAAHARVAEIQLLTQIGAASVAVSTAQQLGAGRDLINLATQAATTFRSQHRMAPGAPIRVIFPEWVVGLVQVDFTSALNADPSWLEYQRSDIERILATRGINITWAQDGITGQVLKAQGSASILDWPHNVVWYMFNEGAFKFLDGGTLDLGVVRDSTLNASNDFQLFTETWEKAAFTGIFSAKITSPVCPSGTTAGTKDNTALCDGHS